MNKKQVNGFSLVELMLSMSVGIIILSGIFSLFVSSRDTQRVSEGQMDMVADARFAIDLIAYDLRHAGMWGGTNKDSVIECRKADDVCKADEPIGTAANDCSVDGDWFHTLSRPVFATNNSNPYGATCIASASEKYKANTDVLEIRYADSNAVTVVGELKDGQVYVRSNFITGKIFLGTNQPLLSAYDTGPADTVTKDYRLHAMAYYISDYSDSVGDGIPSLKRVSLVQGPKLENQLLVSGVVDLQVQFGEDTVGGDQVVDGYFNPQSVSNWENVYAVKIWLLMRAENKRTLTTEKSFTLAGTTASYGADGYRYFMISSVIDLRNLRPL